MIRGALARGVPGGDDARDLRLVGRAERVHFAEQQGDLVGCDGRAPRALATASAEVDSAGAVADDEVGRSPGAGKRGDGAGDVFGAVGRRRDQHRRPGPRRDVNVEG